MSDRANSEDGSPDRSGAEDPPILEIQVHPADIRRGVHYFFLNRRQVRILALAGTAVALVLLLGLLSVPFVVGQLFNRREYGALVAERTHQGERLQALTSRLAELEGATEDLRMQMSRIYVAYGLEGDESGGQGGFPVTAGAVPESIYGRDIRQGRVLESEIREQMLVLGTFVEEVQSFEEAHGDRVKTTPSVAPVASASFVLTSPFGNRRSPFTKQIDFHPGIDLAAQVGTPIHATAEGVVVFAGRYPLKQSVAWWRYGNLVAIRNGDRFITLYGHCDEILVRVGRRVEQGEVIATVGNSGWSTSPHLHYEVRQSGETGDFEPVDPRIYILDHQWRDEERLLVRARRAPEFKDFEPLPRIIGRR